MLGSKAPVIPPAAAGHDDAPVATANGGGATGTEGQGTTNGVPAPSDDARLATIVDELRRQGRARAPKYDALLNGSCRAISVEGGVLTLGFFEDKFHKQQTEEPATRRVFEEIASKILGEAVTIRCIIAPRPARAMNPLVQHAVENGAKIVTEE
jgi:hypothetical protein